MANEYFLVGRHSDSFNATVETGLRFIINNKYAADG